MDVDISADLYYAIDFGVIENNMIKIGFDALKPNQQGQRQKPNFPVAITLKNNN
ncbi:hypothetical protein [Synechococcus sp. M16CYN]|uniref:hypothetical protein n=1 Tax=Synechococcus sp. M16CYN TaxID=3103139 RepID=UPI00324A93B3